MTKDYAWNTQAGLGATEERTTDPEQSSALCLSLAPLPTPSLPILTSERWLLALSNFLSSALYLFQLLRAHNSQIRKLFKNEFKSNEINHRNTLHLWLYILGQEIFEDDYLTRGVEERNKKTTKAFLDHMKWEVTSWWLVFLSALISPQFSCFTPWPHSSELYWRRRLCEFIENQRNHYRNSLQNPKRILEADQCQDLNTNMYKSKCRHLHDHFSYSGMSHRIVSLHPTRKKEREAGFQHHTLSKTTCNQLMLSAAKLNFLPCVQRWTHRTDW